ncbi:hypothetical protein BH10PSE7_BH10PSE7_43120 [soil metagenome]
MLKTLAVTLSLAIATTAAVAAIPPNSDDVGLVSMQVSNAAAKADRLDRKPTKADRLEGVSAKADRLPVSQTLDASLLMTGPVRTASAL